MKQLILNIKKLFKTRKSHVLSIYGNKHEITRIEERIKHKDYLITSVSVTRVDSDGYRGYVDNYLCVVSYNYWE